MTRRAPLLRPDWVRRAESIEGVERTRVVTDQLGRRSISSISPVLVLAGFTLYDIQVMVEGEAGVYLPSWRTTGVGLGPTYLVTNS